ncbi:ABC transporter permease subunit [Halorussus amylolyticus]|uniref:ABC transporter permease subunit n=1 Tax=Halorussus amylolyticus TaxID=1126242 RepID=UPI001046F751|nr:ABC transporter permease subunit [Halorussus amylolyticus]
MSWSVVARKDFEDALRSRMLWGIIGLFAVLMAVSALVPDLLDVADPVAGYGIAADLAETLVPVTALVAAYLAIAGERESGSIKILLGAPHSRLDVTIGKLVGRAGVVVVGIVAGFLVAGVVTLVVYGELAPSEFVSVTLLTAALGVAFVGIAVGISAATATRSRAMALAIGLFFVFALLWDLVPLGITYLRTGSLPTPGATVPAWQMLIQHLNPSVAFGQLVDAALGGGPPGGAGGPGGGTGGGGGAAALTGQVSGPVPFYLEDWFMFVILGAWTVVPVALGYLRFRDADL